MLPDIQKAVITLIVAGVFGGGVTLLWSGLQKRREQEIDRLGRFYQLYGSFISTLRLWKILKQCPEGTLPDTVTRATLLRDATLAEGELESILVRLSSERSLNTADRTILAGFRQSFQVLREFIRDDQLIDWGYSEHPDYLTFKKGACHLAALLARRWFYSREKASVAFLDITSNRHEQRDDFERH